MLRSLRQYQAKMTTISSKIAKECIALFRSCAKSGRGTNDGNNTLREKALEALFNGVLPAEFFTDMVVGAEWTNLRDKWHESIQRLCDKAFETVSVRHLGGRRYNYDFTATFEKDGSPVHIAKVEFKHGASKLTALPQFLSLPANASLFGISYAEFYYDNYLKAYLEADGAFPLTIPDRATYMRYIYQNDYDKDIFFRTMYDRESINKSAKAAIVNRSIHEYLSALRPDLAALTVRFEETQADKHYLLWDTRTFHHAVFTPADLRLTSFDGIKNKNTLIFSSATMVYSCLLRWRNHKGILLPAWQISVKAK